MCDAAHDQHLDAGGHHDPAKYLSSVKHGVYAANFGGGQVDITSGKFVSGAPRRTDRKRQVGAPIKGATLIGNGPRPAPHHHGRQRMALDTGIGTCGKNGQSVPVGVGQPTLQKDRITVGGTGA